MVHVPCIWYDSHLSICHGHLKIPQCPDIHFIPVTTYEQNWSCNLPKSWSKVKGPKLTSNLKLTWSPQHAVKLLIDGSKSFHQIIWKWHVCVHVSLVELDHHPIILFTVFMGLFSLPNNLYHGLWQLGHEFPNIPFPYWCTQV